MSTAAGKCFMCHSSLGEAENGNNQRNSGDNYGGNTTCSRVSKFLNFAENHLEISIKDLNVILEEKSTPTSLLCQECDSLIGVVCELYKEMYKIVGQLTERLKVLSNFLESCKSDEGKAGGDGCKPTTRSTGRVLEERRQRVCDLREMLSQKCRIKCELLSRTLPLCLLEDNTDGMGKYNADCSNKEDKNKVKVEVDWQSEDDSQGEAIYEDNVLEQGSIVPSSEKSEECVTDEYKETDFDRHGDCGEATDTSTHSTSSQDESERKEVKVKKVVKRKREKKIYKSTLKRRKTDFHNEIKSLETVKNIDGTKAQATAPITIDTDPLTTFSCDICSKTFTRKGYIELHKKNVHKIPLPPRVEKHFKCEICSHKYRSKVSLQTHTNRVHGVRVSFSSTNKSGEFVKMHIVDVVKDSDRKRKIIATSPTSSSHPFSCDICKRNFTRKRTVETHKEVKHGIPRPPRKEKNYACDICAKKFIYDSTLKRHMANLHNAAKALKNEEMHTANSYKKDKYGSELERNLNRKVAKQCAPKITENFSCSQCSLQFSSRRLLTYHKYETHKMNTKTLSFMSRLANAKVNVETEINEACVVCQLPFKSWDLLRKHLEHHEATLPMELKCKKCYFCSKSFAHEQTIWAHLRSCITHDFTKIEFPCDHENHLSLPQWSYKTPTQLENHFKEQHGEQRILQCSECDWPFLDKNMLDLHRLCHLSRVNWKYQCPTCHNFFLNSETLRNHYNVVHGVSLKLYRCQVCSWGFPSKNGLTLHMHSHQDSSGGGGDNLSQNKFPCTECTKSYRTAIQLRDHKRGSHVMKQCQECGLIMAKRQLALHFAMNHQGAGSHLCTVCGKVYRTTGSLKKHMTSHGVCQYDCQFCGKKYSVGMLLKRHVARFHSGGNAEKVQNTAAVEGGGETAT